MSSATRPCRDFGSSLNRDASQTAAPVAAPRGAQTSAHQRPSVTIPTGTSRARSSTASRSTAFAVQVPVVVRVSGCVPQAVTMPEQLPRPAARAAAARLGVVAFGVSVVLLLLIFVVSERSAPSSSPVSASSSASSSK